MTSARSPIGSRGDPTGLRHRLNSTAVDFPVSGECENACIYRPDAGDDDKPDYQNCVWLDVVHNETVFTLQRAMLARDTPPIDVIVKQEDSSAAYPSKISERETSIVAKTDLNTDPSLAVIVPDPPRPVVEVDDPGQWDAKSTQIATKTHAKTTTERIDTHSKAIDI
ncbi:unnamed protein product, partial [Mesorhabditis spiculigera]